MVSTVEEEQCVHETEDFEPESLFYVEERHGQALTVSLFQRAVKLPFCARVLDCGRSHQHTST